MFPDFNIPQEFSQLKKCVGCDSQLPRDITHFRENIYYPDGYSNICYECEITYKAKTSQKCIKCGNVYPLLPDYWSKKSSCVTGYQYECKKCKVIDSVERGRNNPERKKKNQENYRLKYLEEIRAKSRIYSRDNKDKARLREIQKRLNNPVQYKAIKKSKRFNYLELCAYHSQKRRCEKKGVATDYTFQELTTTFNGACFYCNMPIVRRKSERTNSLPLAHLDHYIPLSKGGLNTLDNVVWACQPCNNKKGAKLPEEFKEYMLRFYGVTIRLK